MRGRISTPVVAMVVAALFAILCMSITAVAVFRGDLRWDVLLLVCAVLSLALLGLFTVMIWVRRMSGGVWSLRHSRPDAECTTSVDYSPGSVSGSYEVTIGEKSAAPTDPAAPP